MIDMGSEADEVKEAIKKEQICNSLIVYYSSVTMMKQTFTKKYFLGILKKLLKYVCCIKKTYVSQMEIFLICIDV